MDFNNYMSSLENAQNDMVYTQLQTLYLENEALLQYFEGVNKQFQSWLNAKPFNSAAMSAILPKLEPIFSNLASLKFSLMDMEEDEISPQISTKYERLKRNITLLMTYQEVPLYQSRIEQLLEQNDTFKVENLKKAEQAESEKQAQAEQQHILALERKNKVQQDKEETTQLIRTLLLTKISPYEPEMVYIEGGTFTMCIEPWHQVEIKPFAISKYLITVWQLFHNVRDGDKRCIYKGDNFPAVTNSLRFTDSLWRFRFARRVGHKNYRLPTEAEWEYAARGGQFPELGIIRNVDNIAWHRNNSGGTAHEVGTKQPNGYGLYDMLGNVWEMCSTGGYGDYPSPYAASRGTSSIACGGSFNSDPKECHPASRKNVNWHPNNMNMEIGFRLCLSLP
jgi:formylglycine-generating enzyme